MEVMMTDPGRKVSYLINNWRMYKCTPREQNNVNQYCYNRQRRREIHAPSASASAQVRWTEVLSQQHPRFAASRIHTLEVATGRGSDRERGHAFAIRNVTGDKLKTCRHSCLPETITPFDSVRQLDAPPICTAT